MKRIIVFLLLFSFLLVPINSTAFTGLLKFFRTPVKTFLLRNGWKIIKQISKSSLNLLNDKIESYNQAVDAFETKNYRFALKIFKQLADLGIPEAQYNLGFMFQHGTGVDADWKQAASWYLKAAINGLAVAQHDIGICYYHGNGIEQSYDKAIEWMKKSAEQNYSPAQYNLGAMYYSNEAITQDLEESFAWHSKSAKNNDTEASYRSQYNLGWAYETGSGVSKNLKLASDWYLKASNNNIARAQSKMAEFFYKGTGADQDYAKSIYWAKKAAEQGSVNGYYWLGMCYENGNGIEKDLVNAYKFFYLAAKLDKNPEEDRVKPQLSKEQLREAENLISKWESISRQCFGCD